MRFSTIVAPVALLATLSAASPVVVYETDLEYRTVTAVAGEPAPTPNVHNNVKIVYQTVYESAGAVSPVASVVPSPAVSPSLDAIEQPSSSPSLDAVEQPSSTDAAALPSPPVVADPPVGNTLQHSHTAASPVTSLAVSQAPVASPASSPSVEPASIDSFAQQIVNSHNSDRSAHGVGSLTWNSTLAAYAQRYLNSQGCVFAHSGGPYGENIALGYGSPSAAIAAWYDEYKSYNFAAGQFSEATGHFTQMVWKSSNEIGCAQVSCSGGQFFACEYFPRGNVVGEFLQNVFAS